MCTGRRAYVRAAMATATRAVRRAKGRMVAMGEEARVRLAVEGVGTGEGDLLRLETESLYSPRTVRPGGRRRGEALASDTARERHCTGARARTAPLKPRGWQQLVLAWNLHG